MTAYLCARVSCDDIRMECPKCGHHWRLRKANQFEACPKCSETCMVEPNKTSIPDQLQRLAAYAAYKFPDQPTRQLFDIASAGTPWDERKAMIELKEACKAGDHIVFLRFDRGWRNQLDFLTIIEWAKKKHIGLHVSEFGQDFVNDPFGRAMASMLVNFAELERYTISRRRKDNYAYRKANGIEQAPPTAPLGFRHQPGEDGKLKLVPDDQERALLREILTLKKKHGWPAMLSLAKEKQWKNRSGKPMAYSTLRKYHHDAKQLFASN